MTVLGCVMGRKKRSQRTPLVKTINPRTGERKTMTRKKYMEGYKRILKEREGFWHKRTRPGVREGLDGDWERYI